jgi:hypothetical protein
MELNFGYDVSIDNMWGKNRKKVAEVYIKNDGTSPGILKECYSGNTSVHKLLFLPVPKQKKAGENCTPVSFFARQQDETRGACSMYGSVELRSMFWQESPKTKRDIKITQG